MIYMSVKDDLTAWFLCRLKKNWANNKSGYLKTAAIGGATFNLCPAIFSDCSFCMKLFTKYSHM